MKKCLLFALLLALLVSCSDNDDKNDNETPKPPTENPGGENENPGGENEKPKEEPIEDKMVRFKFNTTTDTLKLDIKMRGTLSIDWGDGSTVEETTSVTPSHTYAKADTTYLIKITSPDITEIEIQNSRVSDLEIGGCADLKTLTLKNIEIAKLDITKNLQLKNLLLEKNKLKAIDLTKFELLERLTINENSLENLDLSKNQNLLNITVNKNMLTSLDIHDNIKLKNISVKDNKLKTLYLGKSPDLEKIYLTNNLLTELVATYCVNLSILDINNNSFDSANLDLLFHSLSNKSLGSTKKYVYCKNNPGAATCDKSIATIRNWVVNNY